MHHPSPYLKQSPSLVQCHQRKKVSGNVDENAMPPPFHIHDTATCEPRIALLDGQIALCPLESDMLTVNK